MMFAAHMDEAGLMVSHIDTQGFLRFVPLGELSQQTAEGSRIKFLGGQWGLIGAEKTSDPGRCPTFDQMFIDSGASSRQDCSLRVGDVAVLDHPFRQLEDQWIGKALGDRVGVWLLVETLRSLVENVVRSPHELYFVFSAQQEVGSRGAATAAYKIEPDLAVER
jgi:endoglucanase